MGFDWLPQNVLQDRPVATREALDALDVTGLAEHQDEVEPGFAYLAVASPEQALVYARAAVANGAVLVLAEQALPAPLPVPVLVIPRLAAQRGELASRFYGDPSRRMTCVGVTGTNGKTSVAYHLAQLSGAMAEPAGYSGTLGWGRVEALAEAATTTANAVALQRQLAGLLSQGCLRAMLEVSSHALSQGRADAVAFKVGVFTNLTRDHLDYHHTMEAYGAAKARLFQDWSLDLAVLNADDEFARELAGKLRAPVVTYGHAGDWRWHLSDAPDGGVNVEWVSPVGPLRTTLAVGAEFVVANLTAALATLAGLGHDRSQLQDALAALGPVPGRMQVVPGGQDKPRVIVDYAHTPDALHKALDALRSRTRGRLVCVFGCGGDRDEGKRPLMGEVAGELADHVVLTSDNPRSEDPERIIEAIAAGVGETAHCVIPDRAAAIAAAIQSAAGDDVVLVAGKGHEDYQELADRRVPFDDCAVARSALEA